MGKIKKTILFSSDTVRLELLRITVGDCKMKKYREVRINGDDFEVKELKCIPTWYMRQLKLEALGL